jgi:hypothetical protein
MMTTTDWHDPATANLARPRGCATMARRSMSWVWLLATTACSSAGTISLRCDILEDCRVLSICDAGACRRYEVVLSERDRRGSTRPDTSEHQALTSTSSPIAIVESPPAGTGRETGFVTVLSEPYANVRFDGAFVGATPLMRRPVPVGPHTIELLSPETNVVHHTRHLTVKKNELTTIVVP